MGDPWTVFHAQTYTYLHGLSRGGVIVRSFRSHKLQYSTQGLCVCRFCPSSLLLALIVSFTYCPTHFVWQILYNHALVQLGMCAFHHGMINDAHSALADVHSPPRPKDSKELAKELLAQVCRHREGKISFAV